MKLLAFSVLDEKVQAFAPPFFQSTVGQAVRSFSDLVNDPQSRVHMHPGDYVLYAVGSFDDQEAKFESQIPVRLGSGAEYVESPVVGAGPKGKR